MSFSHPLPLQPILAELTEGYTTVTIVPDDHRTHCILPQQQQRPRRRTQRRTYSEELSPVMERRSQANNDSLLPKQRRKNQRRTVSEELSPMIDRFGSPREVGVSRWEASCPSASITTTRGDKIPSVPLKAPTVSDNASCSGPIRELLPKFPSRSSLIIPTSHRSLSLLDVMMSPPLASHRYERVTFEKPGRSLPEALNAALD